jgi:hypothetical protein
MALSRPESPLSDNPELSSVPSRSAVPVKPPPSRFVTFRLKDSDKTKKNIIPFCIQKAPDSIAGRVTNASRLKNGALLVEARN